MLIIGYENGIQGYKDYLLSEGISPIQTKYGINKTIDNNKTIELDEFLLTFVNINDSIYVISLRSDGYIGFGYIDIELDMFDVDEFNIKEILNLSTDNKQNKNMPGLKVFGKVFYIILRLFEKSDIDEFWFDSANKELSNIYSYLPKNKFFNKSLRSQDIEMSVYKDTYFFNKIKGK